MTVSLRSASLTLPRAALVTHCPPAPPWSGERRRVAAAYAHLSQTHECDLLLCARDDGAPARAKRKLQRPPAPPYAARFAPPPGMSLSGYRIIWVFELWAMTCVSRAYWPQVLWDKDTLMEASYQDQQSRSAHLMARWVALYERHALARVRHAFVSLPGDAQRIGLPNVTTLPHGYEPACGACAPQARRRPSEIRLGFVGLLAHEPNRRGLRWFVQQVLPMVRRSPGLEATELWVAGGGLPAADIPILRETPGVDVKGYVDDLAAFYASVDVVVAPLLDGQGAPTKVVEAMGHCRPVVGTTVGLRGLAGDLRDRCFEVRGDDWASAIRAALRSTDVLAGSPRPEHHSWPAVFHRYVDPIMEAVP